MTTVTLSPEQSTAVDQILDWVSHPKPQPTKPEFKLGGYAGTGKTTVIKEIKRRLDDLDLGYSIAAFTGKACHVLQKKGLLEAQTIHSLIYDCKPLPNGGFEFDRKRKLDDDPDLIIIDEASMISTELYRDLSLFKKKILFVGDPGQLEPVGDNPNLMRSTDITLAQIHRQAAMSPIITFASQVRNGLRPKLSPPQGGLEIREKASFSFANAMDMDQVICAKNATRQNINSLFRARQERPTDSLCVGDKLIVLRNNANFRVFNGMILFIDQLEDKDDHWLISCHDEVDNKLSNIPIWKEPFQKDIGKEFRIPHIRQPYTNAQGPQMVYADFGYCITCHKSQGSEWDKVVVCQEWMPPNIWDMKRWGYTAITRAAEELVYYI